MNKAENIIFHCSATPQGNVEAFRKYHIEKNGWKDIGYNAIILNGLEDNLPYNPARDGDIDPGRGFDISSYIDPQETGAHTLGYNTRALGVCLVGENRFTIKQFESAILLSRFMIRVLPGLKLLGHYETPKTDKTCPNFDMNNFRAAVSDEGRSISEAVRFHLKTWLK